MTAPRLRLAGVTKDYGTVRAVDGLDLDVVAGELLVVLGASGSGKTTVLRLVAGLEALSAGSIWIGGSDVTRLTPGRRNVSMVFQNYALFPHLDVADNIGFGLVARHVRPEEVRRRVGEAAAVVGCEGLLERRPHELSGGERQRVALARAVAGSPQVYLLDEPLSNLDAQLRVAMRAELQRLHRRLGATMIHVTHDQHEGLTMGDRVAILDGGALQQIGTPDDIYRRPANRSVAAFVGTPRINLYPAELRDGAVHAGPFRFQAPPRPVAADARALELGIRPEAISLDGGDDAVAGEVQLVESAGPDTVLHVLADGHLVVLRPRQPVRPAIGEIVRIGARLEDSHLFDARSGVTLRSPA